MVCLGREIEETFEFSEDRVDKRREARGSLWGLNRKESGSNRRSLGSRAGEVDSGLQIGEGPWARGIANGVIVSGNRGRGAIATGAGS